MKSNGFTLTELLVALALLGILVSIGVPSFSRLINQHRLDSAQDALERSIRFTRNEAIDRNEPVVMMPLAGDWNRGWQVFVDRDNNLALGADDVLLLEDQAALVSSVTASGQLQGYLRYNALGESEQVYGGFLAGSFRLCPPDLAQRGRALIINRVGRLRTESRQFEARQCAAMP
ncbi:type IV fimbrial biogenesis protein FimT [Halopseudomonas pachastrellae]|nr:GspH/FimT family pseudopilin [Halopseudomonas pachastrellae]SFM95739.1 type IV fimbrial biogenesis protein FimT [Halopseudomonas pachastrellae]